MNRSEYIQQVTLTLMGNDDYLAKIATEGFHVLMDDVTAHVARMEKAGVVFDNERDDRTTIVFDDEPTAQRALEALSEGNDWVAANCKLASHANLARQELFSLASAVRDLFGGARLGESAVDAAIRIMGERRDVMMSAGHVCRNCEHWQTQMHPAGTGGHCKELLILTYHDFGCRRFKALLVHGL